ncbi:Cyclic nucleotide-binding domain-containing protein [Desulfacinum hydrothermale DSM 13146]|uniref:Cyclic nucleotide-binding domain-containing protein n=1 Tax=Desulfacinum hydrothermale DSM 13146 TaxID=1121390 RepID=A0A1W1XFK7_9BACT|nr:cyclic nucleotide-binding domain-containing protein [Desulfacinum hydrothermale]SMC22805.1 Cyclic nucleotide-binding domain-containing protein [Desulfacinum hydrothermale DSM 13146]
MYILQTDLFRDLDNQIIRRFMDESEKVTFEADTILFREGDPAEYFYVFLKGQVKLSLEEGSFVAYLVSKPGEVFGWSSLLERSAYSATATSLSETRAVRIPGAKMREILESQPESAMRFYRRLAKTLGARLLKAYEAVTSVSRAHSAESHGTGQILSMDLPH